jgi:hypothetical protein
MIAALGWQKSRGAKHDALPAWDDDSSIYELPVQYLNNNALGRLCQENLTIVLIE